ncbi:MAG: hypothetical protein K2M12_01035, partial [Muribaculaceae bacterium]|nr:hypothetical protein [Muribaculaceae bacterium]
MSMIILLYFLLEVGAILGTMYELRRDLMMLQQNSYYNKRYLNWLRESHDTTSGWRLAGLIVLFISIGPWLSYTPAMLMCGIFGFANAVRLARTKYKKPLVWTARARRIYITVVALMLLIVFVAL